MRLELEESDLKKESIDKPTSTIGFEDLDEDAQAAVQVVGCGTFYRLKGTSNENYNRICAPATKD